VMERAGVKLVVVDFQAVLHEQSSTDAAFRRVENVALDTLIRVGRGQPMPLLPPWASYRFPEHRDLPLPRH